MTLLSVADFDRQYCELRPALLATARRRVSHEDAQDLAGACYVEARRSLNAYQPERDLFAWLRGILDNLLRQHFRRLRIRREDLTDETPLLNVEDTEEAEAVRRMALYRRLYRRIAQVDMTARQYECLLRTLAGETQRQIGNELGITQRMVSYHVQAAQEQLRAFAGEDDVFDPGEFEEFFYACAHHPIYRKPHSFDNQSNSVEREQHRYACLREARQQARGERQTRVITNKTA